jgi:hypothetical protein
MKFLKPLLKFTKLDRGKYCKFKIVEDLIDNQKILKKKYKQCPINPLVTEKGGRTGSWMKVDETGFISLQSN